MLSDRHGVFRMVFANVKQYRARMLLTILAIGFSVSLVVAMTSGYHSAERGVKLMMDMFLGSADLTLRHASSFETGVDASVIEQLEADERVAGVDAQYQVTMRVDTASMWGGDTQGVEVMGKRQLTESQKQLQNTVAGRWYTEAEYDADVVVVDSTLADEMELEVGQEVKFFGPDGEPVMLKVIGVFARPFSMMTMTKMVYIPLGTMQRITGNYDRFSEVYVDLHNERDTDAFLADWGPTFETMTPPVKATSTNTQKGQVDDYMRATRVMSYMGGIVTLLAAAFIVFSTLSMGVKERARQLAMLRGIGATRGQIAYKVVLEGLILGALGVALGIPLGQLLLLGLVHYQPDIFIAGAQLSYLGIGFAAFVSLSVALAASLLPAWNASRVDPVEAMAPKADDSSRRINPWLTLIGLFLFLLDTIIVHADPVIGRDAVIWVHLLIGLPAIMIGLLFLGPVMVVLVEQGLGRIVAFILGVRFELLRRQLSGAMWRSVGTSMALLMGLGILVTMHIQSASLVATMQLPERFPDMVIVAPAGLNEEQYSKLDELDGIREGEVMPMALAHPKFGSSVWGITGISSGPQGTMFMGMPPSVAFGDEATGDEGMLELNFVQGNAQDAVEMLKQGDHLIVTEEFHRVKGLNVGDTLELETAKGMVNFKVAGVVRSPGVDLIVRTLRIGREFESWTGGCVFGSLDDAKKYYGVDKVLFFGVNVDREVTTDELVEGVKDKMTENDSVFSWLKSKLAAELGVYTADVRQLKDKIDKRVSASSRLLNILPVCALLIASLGVANTIIASLRSRRWQLGVLRSIGLTRGAMFRLVLAESLLIGACACVMGLGGGMLLAWNANQVGMVITGYVRPYIVPWHYVGLGVGFTLLVACMASFWPALRVALTAPLKLLQAGRGSM